MPIPDIPPNPKNSLQTLPGHLPEFTQRLELPITQFHPADTDNPRIDAQRGRHVLVRADPRVVAHDEIVALCVLGLVERDAPRQVEDAPVGDVADHAALAEDELACCQDESVGS